MAKLQYGLDKEMLKNTTIARKGDIHFKIKYTTVTIEKAAAKNTAPIVDDYEMGM